MVAHTYAGDVRATAAPAAPIRIVPASIPANVAWTASGNAAYALCQWGMLVAFARLGTPAGLGQFAFALAISAPVMMFLQLQLRTVQVTDMRTRFEFADYLALRALSSLTGLTIVVVITAAMGAGPSGIAVAAIVAGIKMFDGLADVLYGAWQKLERLDVPAALLMINGAVSVAALALALWAGASVAGAVTGSLAGSIAALIAAAWLTRTRLHLPFTPTAGVLRRIAEMGRVALPLGFVMALISLTSNIPRYFIQAWLGDRELGIFAALTYVTAAGMTIVSAVGNSLTPAMARAFDRGDARAFARRFWLLAAAAGGIGLSGLLAAVFFGRPLLQIAYGEEYARSAGVFIHAMALGTVTYLAAAVGFAMSAARCFRAQAPVFVVVVATIFAASMAFIPSLGLHGALWGLMLGAAVQLALGAAVLVPALRRAPVNEQRRW
jgi:O-antigen/teichoic acid export membrane protein